MTSLLDELNDEELEASLLWTDDEGENEVINPSDEELLLNDHYIVTPKSMTIVELPISDLIIGQTNNISEILSKHNNNNTDGVFSDFSEDKNNSSGDMFVDKCNYEAGESILNKTISDGIVDLDVTFDTRDVLENSVCESDNDSVLEKTITNDNHDVKPTIVQNPLSDSVELKDLQENVIENLPQTETLEIFHSNESINHNDCISIQLNNNSKPSRTCEDNCIDGASNDQILVIPEKCTETIESYVNTAEELSINTMPSSMIIACDASLDISDSQPMVSSIGDQLQVEPIPADKNTKADENQCSKKLTRLNSSEQVLSVHDAIKNIRETVAKRAKSLSDEEKPVQKRLRCSSDPPTSDNSCEDKNVQEIDKTGISTAATINTNLSIDHIELNQKKQIVSFNFKNYSKNFATDPFDCKACSMKFKEELKFESHLISSHAMSLIINDFEIDLHQYYKQKKEKVIAQCKSTLPKITLQDGNVDVNLIKEYNQNVKLYPAQKNAQYFCKICENVYSTKSLIIEHLKSSKHILRKGK